MKKQSAPNPSLGGRRQVPSCVSDTRGQVCRVPASPLSSALRPVVTLAALLQLDSGSRAMYQLPLTNPSSCSSGGSIRLIAHDAEVGCRSRQACWTRREDRNSTKGWLSLSHPNFRSCPTSDLLPDENQHANASSFTH